MISLVGAVDFHSGKCLVSSRYSILNPIKMKVISKTDGLSIGSVCYQGRQWQHLILKHSSALRVFGMRSRWAIMSVPAAAYQKTCGRIWNAENRFMSIVLKSRWSWRWQWRAWDQIETKKKMHFQFNRGIHSSFPYGPSMVDPSSNQYSSPFRQPRWFGENWKPKGLW